jgi:ABC-type transport system involved in multi-copper enzyme maturation permease subunit
MSALHVTRWTLQEALRRRLLLGLLLLSVAFVALFALGFVLLYRQVEEASGGDRFGAVIAANILTVLGLYAVQFLGAFLALFLSVGAISADADSGMLHAVLGRPLSRWQYLIGRWLAFAALLVGYVLAMSGALLIVARAVAGYDPVDPVRAGALLVLEMLVLLTVGVLGSTVLPTLANGVVTFSLFGLAWLGGIVAFIGTAVSNEAMANLGTAAGLVLPSDALWRGASYYFQSASFLAETSAVGDFSGGVPFAGSSPPRLALLVWVLGYLLVAHVIARFAFARRDF